MKKIIKRTIIVVLSILILCLLMVTASANYNPDGWPLETRASGTISGGVFTDSVCWNGETTLTLNSVVPDGEIRHAYLYTGIWGGHNTGWVNIAYNGNCVSNNLGPVHLQEKDDSNSNVWCTGLGKYWMWYDVTDLTNPGTNTAITSKINGSIDGRVYGILLVVVYEGGDDPKQIQYWINDGSDALNYQTPHNEGITYFAGAQNTDDMATAELTMVHLTGYIPSCSDCLEFNDNILDTSCVDLNRFELNTWDVTDYIKEPDNAAWYSRGTDDRVNVCNAILTICQESSARLEGDVTDTGLPITGADAQLIAQHIVHSIVLTGEDAQAADVNDDMGPTAVHITGTDLQLIRQYIVHIISEFPGGEFIP